MRQVYDVEVVFGPGDQSDLEDQFSDYMRSKADVREAYAFENQWGTSYVLQGDILHGIEWSYVGIEPSYNDDGEEDGYEFEDGLVDFQIDCSWHEQESFDEFLKD